MADWAADHASWRRGHLSCRYRYADRQGTLSRTFRCGYGLFPHRCMYRLCPLARTRCPGRLHYEAIGGVRVFREEEGRKLFQYRCPECGAQGESDGRLVCGKELPRG